MRPLVLGLLLLALAAPDARAAEVDGLAAELARVTAERGRVEAGRRALERAYRQRAAEIARLKAQRSSWGRDRKLQALLRSANDMAARLDRVDAQLRQLGSQATTLEARLGAAIDRELAARPPPEPARRAFLEARRAGLAARPPPGRAIQVPDVRVDPLDDPEDLEFKAAALVAVEARLRVEERRLASRAAHYRRQGQLARARARSEEADVFRDDGPRHAVRAELSGPGREAPDQSHTDPGAPPPPADGRAGEPAAGADPAVILADVIEPGTLDELRRAARSGDPEARARAAAHAQADVRARLERLRRQRLELERRARQLRGR